MEVRWRFLAGCAAATLFLGVLAWGFFAFQFVAINFGESCEDVGFCIPGRPARSTLQAVAAFVGIVAAWQIAVRCARYAASGATPEGVVPRGVVALACLAVWFIAVADLRTPP